jgi:hypothetical protein
VRHELKGDYHQDFIGRLIDDSYTAREFPSLLTTAQREAIIECIRFWGSFSREPETSNAAVARFRGG